MLDNRSKKLLKKLCKTDYLKFEEVNLITGRSDPATIDPVAANLLSKHLIALHWSGKVSSSGEAINDGYEASLEGHAYIEEKQQQFLMFAVPYCITTLIAIANLVGIIAENWSVIQSWLPR